MVYKQQNGPWNQPFPGRFMGYYILENSSEYVDFVQKWCIRYTISGKTTAFSWGKWWPAESMDLGLLYLAWDRVKSPNTPRSWKKSSGVAEACGPSQHYQASWILGKDFSGETWSNGQSLGQINALVVIKLCNFEGGFSMFLEAGWSLAIHVGHLGIGCAAGIEPHA